MESAAVYVDVLGMSGDPIARMPMPVTLTVRDVKLRLAEDIEVPRFAQRLLSIDGSILDENLLLATPTSTQSFTLTFLQVPLIDDANLLVAAIRDENIQRTESELCRPVNPNVYDDQN